MDVGYRSPLLDLFRRGEVDSEIRLLAARGALAPRTHEQLALLAWLVDDADEVIRLEAEGTIAGLPREALGAFLGRADVGSGLREFFAARGVTPTVSQAVPLDEPLIETEPAAETEADDDALGAAQRVAKMTIAERIKAAIHGTREQRTILVRDPNKIVSAAVLSSPKLTESEVEAIARMSNVGEDVLRAIGTSRHWQKSYPILSGLVHNPKTPLGVTLTLLSRLTERDMKMLAVDRNVPEALRLAARKAASNTEARKR